MLNIITVNWNNHKGLNQTLNSLQSQTLAKDHWRFIAIDGFSKDGSAELLKGQQDWIDTLIIEKDNGVYDAMNKGIASVPNNDYFLFLNSGDILANSDTLEELHNYIKNDDENADVYYGDKIDEFGILQKPYTPESMQYGIINACHQCIIYKKNKNMKYDLRYKLFSDLDFTIQYYKCDSVFKYTSMPIAVYEGGGLSSVHQWKTKKEIYIIIFRQFGIIKLTRFLFVKALRFINIKHTTFLNKQL